MNKDWLKASMIRAVRTVAQCAVGVISSTAVVMADVDWAMVISASCLAGIVSILMSVAGLPEVPEEE